MKTTSTLLRNGLMAISLLFAIHLQAEDDFLGLFCPDDQYVNCGDELWDLSIYGNAYYKNYSGTYDAGAPAVRYYLNSCNQGTIVRTWSIYQYGQHLSCSQTIYVGSDGVFDPNDIHWPPKHVDVTGCNPVTDPYQMHHGVPYWDNAGCSMLASSYQDSYFYISGTCDKIIREWTVIDWCIYDPWRNPKKGKYKYYQTIKISVDDVPEVTCPEDIYVNSGNCTDAYVDAEPFTLNPSSCGSNFTITHNSPYADKKGNNISGVYPIGETWVTYTVKYGCGLRETCKFRVVVKDGNKPVPYCYAEMAMPLMGIDNDGDGVNDEGMVEVWAKDLDKGSTAQCNNGPLRYSFSADPDDDVRVFTCDHLGDNVVEMWVTDAKGNQNYCLVNLNIQNNAARIEPCARPEEEANEEEEENEVIDDPSALFSIAGFVKDHYGRGMNDVEVSVKRVTDDVEITSRIDTSYVMVTDTVVKANGTVLIRYWEEEIISEVFDTIYLATPSISITDESGGFSYENEALEGVTYQVTASIDEQEYAEIDMEDVDALFDHLTDKIPFTEPSQYVAADVDGDGKVNFFDMRHMLRYITGRIDAYPIGFGTALLDATMEWTDPSEIIAKGCPDYIMIENVAEDQMDLQFTIVRLGELTGTKEESNSRKISSSRSQNLWDKWLSHEEAASYISMQETEYNFQSINVSAAPNPFVNETLMTFDSDRDAQARVAVFNIEGRRIVDDRLSINKGKNQYQLKLYDQSLGIYLYRVIINDEVYQGKLIKAK